MSLGSGCGIGHSHHRRLPGLHGAVFCSARHLDRPERCQRQQLGLQTKLVDGRSYANGGRDIRRWARRSISQSRHGHRYGEYRDLGGTTSYTFGTGSLTINAGITNNSTALQTFNVGMVLGASQTWTTSSQGGLAFNTINLSNGNTAQTLTISGPGTTTVTGTVANGGTAAGSLSMNGTGTLVLSGANTYTGGTTISSGTVEIGADSAFGTGSVTLNGGTIRAGGGARNLGNAIAAGGDFAIGGSNSLTLNGTLNLTGSENDYRRQYRNYDRFRRHHPDVVQ